MKTIREIAMHATTLSHVTEGNEKISNEEIITNLGGNIEIDEIDRVAGKGLDGNIENVYVYHIKGTKKFAFAGFVLSKIFDEVLNEFEGDYTAVNEELYNKPLAIKMSSGMTRGGRKIALIEVV